MLVDVCFLRSLQGISQLGPRSSGNDLLYFVTFLQLQLELMHDSGSQISEMLSEIDMLSDWTGLFIISFKLIS